MGAIGTKIHLMNKVCYFWRIVRQYCSRTGQGRGDDKVLLGTTGYYQHCELKQETFFCDLPGRSEDRSGTILGTILKPWYYDSLRLFETD